MIERGRQANQPGVQMPAWSIAEGGALNDQDINNVIAFIQYGDWDQVLENAASATGLDKDLPDYSTRASTAVPADPAKLAQVKSTMLAKGCLNCHQVGAVGGKVAADLTDVGSRRTADWLRRWIPNPSAMPATRARAEPVAERAGAEPGDTGRRRTRGPPRRQPFPMNATFMPTIKMTDAELNMLVDYLSHARTGD